MKKVQVIFAMLGWFLMSVATGRDAMGQGATSQQEGSVVVPARPVVAPYRGESGPQPSEITFVPLTRKVTMKVHVEDPNGYFIPNIRREHFVVYEDGVRQKNVDVEIERAPVSTVLLLEHGGRFHELNRSLASEVQGIGQAFKDVVNKDDKVAVFTFADKLDPVLDFSPGNSQVEAAIAKLGVPEVSEVNLFDALLETLNRMRNVQGRKAIILVSTGIDTFSKANLSQVKEAVSNSGIPVYAVGLQELAQREAAVYGPTAPFARVDWASAETNMESIAKASGGRAYVLHTESEIAAIYDDIMENLRTRYVITYVSSNPASAGPPRNIRVALVNPTTGQPLKIHDATGKVIAAKVYVQASYVPVAAAGG
jgi:VWFA-related protein